MPERAGRGFHEKYRVERTDGRTISPLGCFVLEFDDPKAWPALFTYADTVEAADGNVELATEIRRRAIQAEKLDHLPDSYEGWQR